MNYVLPQVRVFQEFNTLPQVVVKNLNVFVFGPQYQLYRYGVAAERSDTYAGSYVESQEPTELGYPRLIAGARPDVDYVKVFADNVLARFYNLAGVGGGTVVDTPSRNHINFDSFIPVGPGRPQDLSRDIKVGDIFRYRKMGGEEMGSARVNGFIAGKTDAKADPPVASEFNAGLGDPDGKVKITGDVTASDDSIMPYDACTVSQWSGTTAFMSLLSTGKLSETFTITVTGAGAVPTVNISSESKRWKRTDAEVIDESVYLGGGVVLNFAGAGEFVVGQVYTAVSGCDYTSPALTNALTRGDFTGETDKTYIVTVDRGGVFEREVKAYPSETTMPELTVYPGHISSTSANWSAWNGGETETEYILRCTSGGDAVAEAEFEVVALDGQQLPRAITFTGDDTRTALLDGLVGYMSEVAPAEGMEWLVRVDGAMPLVRVRDNKGASPETYFTSKKFKLGDGLTFDFGDVTQLNKGDVYHVVATAPKPKEIDTIVLSRSIEGFEVGEAIDGTFCVMHNDVEIPHRNAEEAGEVNWRAGADGVTVNPGIKIQDPTILDRPGHEKLLSVISAELYVQYRALLVDNSTAIGSIQNLSELTKDRVLGTIDPDNPLAQCVYHAKLNSGNKAVYYMALPSNDEQGWARVLEAAALSNSVYMMVPTTGDSKVLTEVRTHIEELSKPDVKRWRIGFFGPDIPKEDPIYTAGAHPLNIDFTAVVAPVDATPGAENLIVKFVKADGTTDDTVVANAHILPGDEVRIQFGRDAWQQPTYKTYTVDTVLTNTSLRLKTGPAEPISTPEKVEVIHPYGRKEQAKVIATQSGAFYNRRIYRVYPDHFYYNGIMMNGAVAAAAVSGLASSVAPQQPITNVELLGFDDIPAVYQTFSRTELDVMAELGTLLVMQDTAGDKVYVRHQISTRRVDGDLNSTELSLVKNLDSVSFYFAKRYEPYIGKYNITPALLRILNLIMKDGIAYLGSQTNVGLLGPQILLEETEIGAIMQHPQLKDHATGLLKLGLPKPFNNFDLTIMI